MKIGIAGTGRMGTAIAWRLLGAGHEVCVWNRTAGNARDARDAGAKWAPTLRELVQDSHVVISFLLDDAAAEGVYLGNEGLLKGSVEGRLFIDMGTVSPAIHIRIAAALAGRKAAFIECPVSGSVSAALSGTLVGFVGGVPADLVRAQPLLGQLCRRVEHLGPMGAGTRMKLASNLLLTVFWQAFGEAMLLAQVPDAAAANAIDLLADTNIGAAILRTRGRQVVAALHGQIPGVATFDVDTMRKDLRCMAEEAALSGRSLPLASRALECFDRASQAGAGGVDGAAYPAWWISAEPTSAQRT